MLRELGSKAPGKNQDDQITQRVARFQIALDKAKDDIARYHVFKKAGDLGLAYDFWDESVPASVTGKANRYEIVGACRHELEARLLCKQPKEQIADTLCLTPEIVDIYEKVFFNVLDRLNKPSYIVHQVLGAAIYRGMNERDYPTLLKSYAYFSQTPELVDALVTTFDKRIAKNQPPAAFLAQDWRWNTTRKSAMAARMIPLSSADKVSLPMMELEQKIREADQVMGAIAEQGQAAGELAMLACVPWALAESKKLRAEPRAHELIEMAAGQIVKIESYDDFTYPEVKREEVQYGKKEEE